MKALRALLLIPLLPVLIGTVMADLFSDAGLELPSMRMTNRILDAVLS